MKLEYQFSCSIFIGIYYKELREMLEHERIKREKMEATIVELRNQVGEFGVYSYHEPRT